jgi:hypothetical protein
MMRSMSWRRYLRIAIPIAIGMAGVTAMLSANPARSNQWGVSIMLGIMYAGRCDDAANVRRRNP